METANSRKPADEIASAWVKHAEALFVQWRQEFGKEWDRRLEEVQHRNLSSPGRAAHRLEIYEELLSQEVKKRIRIYKQVVEQHDCPQMLSKLQLDALRERIMADVQQVRLALQDRNARDFRAAGDALPAQADAVQQGVERQLEPRILDVVNVELQVLETEAAARESKQWGVPC